MRDSPRSRSGSAEREMLDREKDESSSVSGRRRWRLPSPRARRPSSSRSASNEHLHRPSSSSPQSDRSRSGSPKRRSSHRSRRDYTSDRRPSEDNDGSSHRSRSRSEEARTVKKQNSTIEAPESSRRQRRTGWDDEDTATGASLPLSGAAFPAAAPVSSGTSNTSSNLLVTGGKTAEQIRLELAERQAQAAAAASSMHQRATLHQMCRVYVGSLDYSLTDSDIRQVFSVFGPIINIDMPREGTRSKGFCFVEYSNPESADMALKTMRGFNLKGRTIKVGRPTAIGSTVAATPVLSSPAAPPVGSLPPPVRNTSGVNAAEAGQIAAAMLLGKGETPAVGADQHRIYVGNVPYNFTADDIRQIFDVFGTILSCQLIPSNEKPGTHRGYGFIEFANKEHARMAIETMNDFHVAGKVLKVNYATTLRGPTPAPI